MTTPSVEFGIDDLRIRVFASEADMARAAASRAAGIVRQAVDTNGHARLVLATGNSQLAFVEALSRHDLPWESVIVFHMDEYLGIGADHPASFRRWMRERVAPLGARLEYLDGDAADPAAECSRYEGLIRAEPLDLVCMGIGENGHLAFNEPGRTDFDDPRWVRIVELTTESSEQQVGEGHFPTVDDVPHRALSLTVPALLSARDVQVCVPEARKAAAVAAALYGPITPQCPASAVRRVKRAVLFGESASVPAPADGHAQARLS